MHFQNTNDSIYKRQKALHMRQCFHAQKTLYTYSKILSAFQFSFSVGCVCVCTVFYAVTHKEIWYQISIILTCMLLFLSLVLDRSKNEMKRRAASIQQYIDVKLFATADNIELWGELPSVQKIAEWIAKTTGKKTKMDPWYANYSQLPHHEQVVHCQAENVRWNQHLSRDYFIVVNAFCVLCCLAFLAWELFYLKPSLLDFVSAITGLFPLLQFVITWDIDMLSADKKLQSIQLKIDSILSKKDEGDVREWEKHEIAIQSSIYEYRKASVMIPDWFYKLRQHNYEKIETEISKAINKKR